MLLYIGLRSNISYTKYSLEDFCLLRYDAVQIRYECFREAWYLNLLHNSLLLPPSARLHGIISQHTLLLVFTSVRTSNLSYVVIILWHDAWTPEVCSQRSTAETSIARKRLDKPVSAATNTPVKIKALPGGFHTFSWQRAKRRITEDNQQFDLVISIQSAWS
jgi:hypothetical protein